MSTLNLHVKSLLFLGCLLTALSTQAAVLRITIESTAPLNGTTLTPFWFGLHDGNFDLFDTGVAASTELERIAEDGNIAPLRTLFAAQVPGGMDVVITGPANPNGPPLVFPQTQGQLSFNFDETSTQQRYWSFASMILPSNDAFIGNDDPRAYPLFDADGNFIVRDFIVTGDRVYDAGTEINDEAAANVPLLGQTVANSGTTENGVVADHPGFAPNGAILGSFPQANFNNAGYPVVRIIVEMLPVDNRVVEVEITNLAPAMGSLLTPFWTAFHDGTVDFVNAGEAASAPVEAIAEDGNIAPMRDWFAGAFPNGLDGVLTGPANPNGPPLFFQGQSNSLFLQLDANNPAHSYFSYMSMILPSNDAFIANDNGMAYRIFENAQFQATEITIPGSKVYDAGTEVNDEAPQNVPVLGQATPNTGVTEGGVVSVHPGFNAGGAVLGQFPFADFTTEGYYVARIALYERFNPWSGIPLNPDGYRGSPVFGIADDSGYPWINHTEHGMIYFPRGGSSEGFRIFNEGLGFVFTSAIHYPLIFRESDQIWYRYIEGTRNPRQFENLSTNEIIEIE